MKLTSNKTSLSFAARCSLIVSLVLGLIPALSNCGRYGPPVTPESTAPAALAAIRVEPGVPDGLSIKWEAPKEQVRGEPLRAVTGYKVFRAEITDPAALKVNIPDFVEISNQPDKFYSEVQKKNPLALKTRFPTRRFGVSTTLKKHEYLDVSAIPGHLYFYKLVGESNEGVLGTPTYYQVLFDGPKSIIRKVPTSSLWWSE